MRIVNLEEFRKLPSGTLFMKYQPQVFDNLCSKGDTWETDFLYDSITDCIENDGSGDLEHKLDLAESLGVSLKMDFDFTGRDGCFMDDQLFAVYEKRDVEMLIEKLNRCLISAYNGKPESD